jgi:ATP-dependent RNA helicase DeaD
MSARKKQVVSDVVAQLQKGTHQEYLDVVRALSGTTEVEEVAAVALFMAFGEMKVAELQKRAAAPFARPVAAEKGMTRLFFTLGRKDRVQVAEIVRAIAEESNIPGRRVGKIDIREQFTFVEVPVDIAEKVIVAMDNAFIRGKRIAVKKALPPAGGQPKRKPR